MADKKENIYHRGNANNIIACIFDVNGFLQLDEYVIYVYVLYV